LGVGGVWDIIGHSMFLQQKINYNANKILNINITCANKILNTNKAHAFFCLTTFSQTFGVVLKNMLALPSFLIGSEWYLRF